MIKRVNVCQKEGNNDYPHSNSEQVCNCFFIMIKAGEV